MAKIKKVILTLKEKINELEEKLKEYQNQMKELKKKISEQNKIINHLSKLEDMGDINRDTKDGFIFYYSHRQNYFKELFDMEYSTQNLEIAYRIQQGSFKRNRGINKIPCEMSQIIKKEIAA